jgi:hypothetical protein
VRCAAPAARKTPLRPGSAWPAAGPWGCFCPQRGALSAWSSLTWWAPASASGKGLEAAYQALQGVLEEAARIAREHGGFVHRFSGRRGSGPLRGPQGPGPGTLAGPRGRLEAWSGPPPFPPGWGWPAGRCSGPPWGTARRGTPPPWAPPWSWPSGSPSWEGRGRSSPTASPWSWPGGPRGRPWAPSRPGAWARWRPTGCWRSAWSWTPRVKPSSPASATPSGLPRPGSTWWGRREAGKASSWTGSWRTPPSPPWSWSGWAPKPPCGLPFLRPWRRPLEARRSSWPRRGYPLSWRPPGATAWASFPAPAGAGRPWRGPSSRPGGGSSSP